MEIGIGRTIDLTYEAAVAKVEDALRREGFGVLTRIDVKATMKEKLGADVAPYVILGACNPPLAHRALTTEPEIGLMLPCNVVVRALPGGRVRVEAINAEAMASLFPKADLAAVSHEVGERLARVIASM